MKQSKGERGHDKLLKQRASGQGAVQIGHAVAVTIVQVVNNCRHRPPGRKTGSGVRLTACGVRGVRWAW